MLRVVVATDERQRADAVQVRSRVYCEEERMLEAPPTANHRSELTATDLLVYAGEQPIGALRLSVAQPRHHGQVSAVGFELAQKFALRGFDQPDIVLGEVTGFCVLRRYRGTRAASALFGALRLESERRGVTHWVAAANTETDCAEDADIIYRVLQSQCLVSQAFHAEARYADHPARPARFAYTPAERQRARGGELQGLKLPKVLALFANKMGARYIGQPAYDRDFNVFATPLAVEL